MNPVRSLLRKLEDNKTINIISISTHERYETGLCKANVEIWSYEGQPFKTWNSTYAPKPDNYHLIQIANNYPLPRGVDFDCVLAQCNGHFQFLQPLARELHLPIIKLEHTLPVPEWPISYLEQFKNMRGDINLFISEFSRAKWGWSENEADVIHHGIDTEIFNDFDLPRIPRVLSVCNDWINRDWCCGFNIWKNSMEGLPVFPVGATPGLSEPAKDVEELVNFYNTSQVFVNTSLISPVPTALLEAMSCGCACVTTNTCMIPEIVVDGHNGFLCSDTQSLREKTELCLSDPDLCKQLGQNARQTVIDKFGMDKFVNNWNNILQRTKSIIYRG